jgi:hypothetical protein
MQSVAAESLEAVVHIMMCSARMLLFTVQCDIVSYDVVISDVVRYDGFPCEIFFRILQYVVRYDVVLHHVVSTMMISTRRSIPFFLYTWCGPPGCPL